MTASLIAPTPHIQASFLAALHEFHAEGRDLELDAQQLSAPAQFDAYVRRLHADARADTPRPPGIVAMTTLWYADGDDFLGTLQIRHDLTPLLSDVGGHIGYQVRPSARRCGHATRMLAMALPIARDLGIDPALVTCDRTNVASQKVIEANGGVPTASNEFKLRYWISTRP